MRLKIILGSVLVVAVIVAGCGGGGDTSGGTGAGGTGATTAGAGTDTTGASTDTTGASTDTTGASTDTTGASTDGGGGGKPLTKKEFIKQGDEICAGVPTEYEELKAKLEKESKKAPTPAEVNLAAAVPPVETAAKQMAELTPPKGDEAEVEAIIAALEAAGKGVEEEPTAELVGPKSPYAEFQKLTKEYGFTFCNQL